MQTKTRMNVYFDPALLKKVEALAILEQQQKLEGSPYVFPADKLGRKGIDRKYFQGTESFWYEIRKAARLEDVRLHDLRHTAASIAVADGASLPIIGRILGHADTKTTQRYAHLSDAPVREAVEKLAAHVDNALAGIEKKNDPAPPSPGLARIMGAPRPTHESGWRPARRVRR